MPPRTTTVNVKSECNRPKGIGTFNEKYTTLHTLIDAHKKSEGKGEGEDRTPFGEFQKTF